MRRRRASSAAIRSSGSSGCSRPPSIRSERPARSAYLATSPAVLTTKPPLRERGFRHVRDRTQALFLEAEACELLLEPRQAAAAIDQLLLAAGPGRMRLRIDVEVQRVARLAP